MSKTNNFTLNQIKYLLKKYPYMKKKGIYKEITGIIEKCIAKSDEETKFLAEKIYFKGKTPLSMQFEIYLSESQILRKLNILKKEIIIESVLSGKAKIFKTAYSRLHK